MYLKQKVNSDKSQTERSKESRMTKKVVRADPEHQKKLEEIFNSKVLLPDQSV